METLQNLFNEFGCWVSRDTMFQRIQQRNLPIKRRDVQTFLNRQELYQLHKPIVRMKTVYPIICTKVLQRVQIDLVDMENLQFHNRQYKYLLVAIDLLSKYCWTYAIKNKESESVANALEEMMTTHHPSIVQSDSGLEFMGELKALLEQLNIKQVFSLSHTAQSQGCVEKMNQNIKRKLYSRMTKNGNKNWVDHLEELTEQYNTSYHSVIKMTPEEAFNGDEELIQRAAENVKLAASKMSAGNNVWPVLKALDYVRISKFHWEESEGTTSAENRYKKKQGFDKGYHVNWSRQIYVVVSVSTAPLPQTRYKLSRLDGTILEKHFRRDYLQLLPKDDKGLPDSIRYADGVAVNSWVDDVQKEKEKAPQRGKSRPRIPPAESLAQNREERRKIPNPKYS